MIVAQTMAAIREMERIDLGYVLRVAGQHLLMNVINEVRERRNNGNSQILDMRKSTDGPFPEMGITRGAVDLDGKLRSSVLALESLKCLTFPSRCRVGIWVSN